MGVSCSGSTPASASNGFPGVDGGVALGDGTSLKRGGESRNREATPFSLATSSKKKLTLLGQKYNNLYRCYLDWVSGLPHSFLGCLDLPS